MWLPKRAISSGALSLRPAQYMKAVVARGNVAVLDSKRSRPRIRDDDLMVRTVAIALNPTDWKSVSYGRAADSCILGCDYAGIVEEVGPRLGNQWRPGDRVFGCGHGANITNPDDGVFAEYAAVKGDLQMRIPRGLSFEDASTMPLGLITVGQGLFQKALQLDMPAVGKKSNSIPVLIYGGATATGTLAIQLAKLAGYTVITTCSPEWFSDVKDLGADLVFDYHDHTVGSQIRRATNNTLRYAWDTISIPGSAQICADALSTYSSDQLRYGNLLPVKSPRSDVVSATTVMYTVFGRDFMFGTQKMSASQEDHEFGRQFYKLSQSLIEQGHLKPHPAYVGQGGLKGAVEGLKVLQEGVRRGKLVYRISDTS